jgi:hypothetical protein
MTSRGSEMVTFRLTQYRFAVFNRPAGAWHNSRNEAERDALRQRMASQDRETLQVFITVPGRIEHRDAGWVRWPAAEFDRLKRHSLRS